MNQESFKTIEDYAKVKGLSVGAYINSVLDSYTEWFIPLLQTKELQFQKKHYLNSFRMLVRRV